MVNMKRIPGRVSHPQASIPLDSIQNNFVGGLKTEFTGMNFPENSCTATENCVFTLIGDVTRRSGIDFELNFSVNGIGATSGLAINTYKWNNVGGDGQTQIIVVQVGSMIYFYQNTNSTITSPLSTTLLISTVNIRTFQAPGNTDNPSTIECQFTDGNGYLFVFHPDCDPLFCTYVAGTVTASSIQIQIRDFQGIFENTPIGIRPNTLTAEHNYNLFNQGWLASPPLTITYNATWTWTNAGNYSFVVSTGLSLSNGTSLTISGVQKDNLNGNIVKFTVSSSVVSYNSGTGLLVISLPSDFFTLGRSGTVLVPTTIATIPLTTINTWFSALTNYPSNADIWWTFKNTSGVFSPSTTAVNVSVPNAQAPQGAFILNAFNQDRSGVSGISGLTGVSTSVRPRTGTWFQGRIWYAGVDSAQPATGDAIYYTWTENIYFSQIVTSFTDFGSCYQVNDPTSQTFFNLLPTDGGVITIQGSGAIYKLVPVQNGLLVFAANGIWFITGSTGAGFSATDYVITKISNIQSISSTSYVNVLGTIVFWNEEGIYTVTTTQSPEAQAPLGRSGGGFSINNICVGTILSFYQSIPLQSKKFVRGDYNPMTYTIKWIYKSNNEIGTTDRWQFDSVLNYNTLRESFYPYQILNTTPTISGINYTAGPGGSTSPSPTFKYLTATSTGITFSEERDSTNWVDFFSFDGVGVNYTSFFQTAYNLGGMQLVKFQPIYVTMISKPNMQYQIQSIFDYAIDPQSGRYSQPQLIIDQNQTFQGLVRKRHRLRGNGYVFQILITSIPGQPFDIQGWAIYETKNVSV